MSEVQARLRAALVAIAEEDVNALYEEEIEYAIATLLRPRPEEDARGTVSGACAAVGRLDLLVEARVLGYPWNAKTCANAAWSGYFRILEYAHERGCPWDEGTCACAAYTGHLGCLKYAQDHSAPESARYVVGWQRICACTTDLIVQIALSRQRDGYVSLRELTPAVNHFLRAWPELDLPEDVIRRILFDADLKPMTSRARFSRMIALYATK